jgi:hypothetical protein
MSPDRSRDLLLALLATLVSTQHGETPAVDKPWAPSPRSAACGWSASTNEGRIHESGPRSSAGFNTRRVGLSRRSLGKSTVSSSGASWTCGPRAEWALSDLTAADCRRRENHARLSKRGAAALLPSPGRRVPAGRDSSFPVKSVTNQPSRVLTGRTGDSTHGAPMLWTRATRARTCDSTDRVLGV